MGFNAQRRGQMSMTDYVMYCRLKHTKRKSRFISVCLFFVEFRPKNANDPLNWNKIRQSLFISCFYFGGYCKIHVLPFICDIDNICCFFFVFSSFFSFLFIHIVNFFIFFSFNCLLVYWMVI